MKQLKLFLIFAMILLVPTIVNAAELQDIIEFWWQGWNGASQVTERIQNNNANMTATGTTPIPKGVSYGAFPSHNSSTQYETDIESDTLSRYSQFGISSIRGDLKGAWCFSGNYSSSGIGSQTWVGISKPEGGVNRHMSVQYRLPSGNLSFFVQEPASPLGTVEISFGEPLVIGKKTFFCIGNTGEKFWGYHNGSNKTIVYNQGAATILWYGNSSTTYTNGTFGTTCDFDFRCRFDDAGLNIDIAIYLNDTPTTEQLDELWNLTLGSDPANYTNLFNATASDTTLPIVNVSLNNTSPKINEWLNISANITDETGLLFANWSINFTTGLIKQNYSISGTSFKFSNRTQITDSRGNVLNITVYATDTSNNVQINSTIINVADTLGSILIGLNTTTPRINGVVNISGNATDADADFSLGYISYNISGNPQRNFTYAISGSKGNFSQNITINLTRGNVINFSVFYNDTAGTIFQASLLLTVNNTPPNGTNFVNTTGKHYNTNITRLNSTPSNNLDNDVLRYVVFSDTTNPPTALYYNGTDLNISTNWTEDNTYFYQIKVMDEISESDLSPVFNLTLDTGIPTLTINISNNTIIRINQTINITIDDTFPYNLTMRIYRGTNDYYSIINSTAVGRLISIIANINLTEDGNYTLEINGSDSDKTSPIISDRLSNWKVKNELLSFNTSKGQGVNLDIKFKGNAPPSNFNSFSYFNEKGTHIDFGVNYTANATELLPVFNVKANNMDISYLNDSIKGHFIFPPYGIDFEGELKINNSPKDYIAEIKKISNTNYQVDIVPNETINIGDNISFISSSVFGLNTIDVFYNIVNDQTMPNIFNITPLNNTFTGIAVNFTANITETSPDKMELWINSTGTWHLNRTASYINNITSNFSLFSLNEGIYKWTICANDTIGGYGCFAENYTLTIDITLPIITLESPANNTVITAGEKPNVNFRVSSNENVKNCSLFFAGSLLGNESTQKKSHNFTVNSVDAGKYTWNATCYDISNNLGASALFNIEIGIVSGGSGSVSQPAGGGGVGTPSPTDEEVQIIDRGYTLTYICGKAKKFLNDNPNYDLSNIVLLQEDIRFEINFVIPFTTLKGYITNYKTFCEIKIEEQILLLNKSKKLEDISQLLPKSNFNFDDFFKLPFFVNFGALNKNSSLPFFNFLNLIFPLSVSDKLSDNPNIVWEGNIKVYGLIGVILIIIIIAILVSNRKLFKDIQDVGEENAEK